MHPRMLLISVLSGVIDFVWRYVHQRSILASGLWLILGPAALLAMLATSVSYAQVPRAPVYIQSPQGLGGALAASIAKRNPHVRVVTDSAEATYVLSVSPLELTTSMTFVSKHVRASVMLIEGFVMPALCRAHRTGVVRLLLACPTKGNDVRRWSRRRVLGIESLRPSTHQLAPPHKGALTSSDSNTG